MDSNNTFRGSTPLAKARIPPRSIKRHYNEFQFDKQSESAKKKAKKKKNSTIRNHVTAKFPCYPRSHHSWLTINHERLTWHVDHSFQRIYLEHFDNLSSVCSEYGSLNQPTSWLILVDERITLISLINWLAEAFTTNLLTNQIPYQRFSYNIVWRSLKGVEFSRNDFEGWRKEFN